MAATGLINPIRRGGRLGRVLTLMILFCLLVAAVAGLSTTLRGPDLGVLWISLLCGLLLSWSLAYQRQPVFGSIVLLFLTGSLLMVLLPGGLAVKLWLLFVTGIRWLVGQVPFLHFTHAGNINPQQLVALLLDLNDAATVLVQRSVSWSRALAGGKPVFDPLAATLIWNGVIWVISAWAGWVVEAYQNALLAVLPALLLNLGTLSSGRHMASSLYILLGLTLLALAFEKNVRRQFGWSSDHAAYPARKGSQIIGTALFLSIALVLSSASLSSLSTERIRHWIDELRQPASQQNGNLAQSLGIVPGGTAPPDTFKQARNPGLPRDHLIGSGPDLSSRAVMTVRVNDITTLFQGGQPLPLYWRGYTYDVYTGQGWSSSATNSSPVAANAAIQANYSSQHLLIRSNISPVEDLGGTVYAAGEPIRLNVASEIAWRTDGDLFGLVSVTNSAYEVDSLIPIADEKVLQKAGESYPNWVDQRFFSLPEEVPGRVKNLALQLTANVITPYDRAVAIQSYLRKYPYTLDVSLPPNQRDVTDYFLFDLKKGYCDYFATAMVVLARAAGVPARLAIGYAPGTYNLNSRRFVVTEADAHSWAEIYFPKIGWVPFEATPSHPVLNLIQPVLVEANPPSQSPVPANRQVTAWHLPWAWYLALFLGLLALIGIAWMGVEENRLYRLSGLQAASLIYQRLKCHASHLGVYLERGFTPYEFSQAFSKSLENLATEAAFDVSVVDLSLNIQKIITEISLASYQKPSSAGLGLVTKWRKLRWQLWLLRAHLFFRRKTAGGYSQADGFVR